MQIHFYSPAALIWLWIVPALTGLYFYAATQRRKAVKQFGTGIRILSRSREAIGVCLGATLIVFSLARPAWNLKKQYLQETGRDVIFLLDVSRSMLAEDMHPNRLENAKLAILDCLETLAGDRIGLVVFAGSAEIRCPLTVDYDYFRMALRQVSPDSVTVGGTQIANALEKVINKLLKPEKAGLQDVILITDGEDMVEGLDEVEAAQKLSEAGARLIAIGIGDRTRGSRIAVENEETGTRSFLKYDHKEVWTRLHSETLHRMTSATSNGIYFEVGSGPFNLKDIYWQVMQRAERVAVDSQVVENYEEKFHLFLLTAFGILFFSFAMPHKEKATRKPLQYGEKSRPRRRNVHTTVQMAVLLLLLAASTASADDVSKLFREGIKAHAAGDYEKAVELFTKASELEPESVEINYNLGIALYRSGNYEEARNYFEYVAMLDAPADMRSRCWYNLANCLIQNAEQIRQQDPYSALEFYQQSAYFYRVALDCDPNNANAAYNLEVAQRLTAQLQEDIRQKEEKEQQQNELLKYIREKLEEFIQRQTALNRSTTDETLVAAAEQQIALEKDTRELIQVIEETKLHEPITFPDGTTEPGPLQKTFEHTVRAADAMNRAVTARTLDQMQPEQKTALEELIAALGSAPSDPDQQENQSDEDSSEKDQSDMDYEESDEEADMYEEADPFGDFSEYEEIRGVPPPNQTEMDILAEELRNQERRKQKKAGQYKSVDKDW